MLQICNVIKEASTRLTASDSAQLDAELLLCYVLDCERSKLYAHPEQKLSDQELIDFNYQILLRAQGHPIAHLLNKKEFWSLELYINEHTLIPRPETELLVETALKYLPVDKQCDILELGTGSGAIALAIASECSKAKITATDICNESLAVAKDNADRHNIKNISFINNNWFNNLGDKVYDLIISNPPYICIDDPHLKQGDVRFEPKLALVSGVGGLGDIKTIINNACTFLKQDGRLLLEHGYQQAEMVRALFKEQNYQHVETLHDYNGLERVSLGQVA